MLLFCYFQWLNGNPGCTDEAAFFGVQLRLCAFYFAINTREVCFMDYKEAYFALYSELANIIEQLEELQLKYEEKYIESNDEQ